jgi:GNAT superfamily N-acetyltransferase
MKITIKEISPLETHEVRWPVLRKGLTREDCVFSGDELPTTIHLGAFKDLEIVGVTTLLEKQKKEIQEEYPQTASMYQLRGMAVLEDYQGHNIGTQLLHHAEEKIKGLKADVLWFHARTSAVKFYQKMGYQVIGEEIYLEPAGPHFKMAKRL